MQGEITIQVIGEDMSLIAFRKSRVNLSILMSLAISLLTHTHDVRVILWNGNGSITPLKNPFVT
jgi:hypothetical protein